MWELEGRLSYTVALKVSILIVFGFYFLKHTYKAKKAFAFYYMSCDAHIRSRGSFFPCSLHWSIRKRSEQRWWPPFSLCHTSQYGLCPDLTDDLFLQHAQCAKSGTESMPKKKCRCTSAGKLWTKFCFFSISSSLPCFPSQKLSSACTVLAAIERGLSCCANKNEMLRNIGDKCQSDLGKQNKAQELWLIKVNQQCHANLELAVRSCSETHYCCSVQHFSHWASQDAVLKGRHNILTDHCSASNVNTWIVYYWKAASVNSLRFSSKVF